ncbi:MAG: hypothetical protein EA377_12885 [Phycisphaerales bacterium]|nr:MAG: hypothetical protein EA377_12885 [Phycisphaerales bacterium]
MKRHRQKSWLPLTAFVGIALLMPALAGCGLRLNTSAGLDGVDLPALVGAEQSFVSDTPSVTQGHDRSHWPRITVQVRRRQIEHHPQYVRDVTWTDQTARQRSEAPTIDTVLETEENEPVHLAEGAVDLLLSGGVLIFAPIEMIVRGRHPWRIERPIRSTDVRLPDHEYATYRAWIDTEGAITPQHIDEPDPQMRYPDDWPTR